MTTTTAWTKEEHGEERAMERGYRAWVSKASCGWSAWVTYPDGGRHISPHFASKATAKRWAERLYLSPVTQS